MYLGQLRGLVAPVAAFVALGIPSYAAADPPAAPAGSVWQQVFADEFDGSGLDSAKWSTCYWWANPDGCTNGGNGELEVYEPGNVVVGGGEVKLEARHETMLGPGFKTYEYTSGMISSGRPSSALTTPPPFEFTYGYAEARARPPVGKGLWPAFWLLPSSQSWPPEIDGMEMVGDKPNLVDWGVHYVAPDGSRRHQGGAFIGSDLSAAFHTFGVDWEPEAITWYLDGGVIGRVTDPTAIPSEPMYLLADLAVGGPFPGPPDATTPFPSDFEIDSVRVWQRVASPSPPAAAPTSTEPAAPAPSSSKPAATKKRRRSRCRHVKRRVHHRIRHVRICKKRTSARR